jgi:hypothetical protein
MQDLSYEQLKNTLSAKRLESYRHHKSESDEQLVACYLWNLQLSESLYPLLSALEVALRNQLHNALTKRLASEQWYDIQPFVLTPAELVEITKAKEGLLRRKKSLEPGRIIAELQFGFWTSLFHASYEKVLWPDLIHDVFPYSPRWIRERKKLSKRLNQFRHLRNRVFHYEPIWGWENLGQLHQDMTDTVGWMCQSTKTMILKVDRFHEIHQSRSEFM